MALNQRAVLAARVTTLEHGVIPWVSGTIARSDARVQGLSLTLETLSDEASFWPPNLVLPTPRRSPCLPLVGTPLLYSVLLPCPFWVLCSKEIGKLLMWFALTSKNKSRHISLYCASQILFFNKWRVCGNPVLSDDDWHFLARKYF